MSFSFTGGDWKDETSDRIDIDDLYESKKRSDTFKLEVYTRVLNRIHAKIKLTSRMSKTDQFCWYVVPEMMLGAPSFNKEECIAYILDKLQENGFHVRYTHPNLILISWAHWVPTYVRNEIKKKTGVSVNGFGEKVVEANKSSKQEDKESLDSLLLNPAKTTVAKKESKDYKSVSTYQPSGALTYTDDMLADLNSKLVKRLNK